MKSVGHRGFESRTFPECGIIGMYVYILVNDALNHRVQGGCKVALKVVGEKSDKRWRQQSVTHKGGLDAAMRRGSNLTGEDAHEGSVRRAGTAACVRYALMWLRRLAERSQARTKHRAK